MDKEYFDYVVVGSGAGGGVVASKLARAGFKVVVLEAGGDPIENESDRSPGTRDVVADYSVPAFHTFASEHPDMAWDFWVRHYADNAQQQRDSKYSQEHDGVLYPRSGTLGGCTAHNAMITVYPHNADWNHIAESMDDPSWRASCMRKYIKRMERCRYRYIYRFFQLLGWNPTGHGWNGWLQTEKVLPLQAIKSWRLRRVLRSAVKSIFRLLGHKKLQYVWLLKSQGDPNDQRLIDHRAYGIRYAPLNTVKHARHGTRELLRETEKKYGNNLTIRLHALAAKILFDEEDPSRAVGVEYLSGQKLYQAHQNPSQSPGERCRVYARREVIVAGGAFNSPQLLMLSGIGPKEELRKFDISCWNDLKGVGMNLQDRYEVSVVDKMKQPWKLLEDVEMEAGDKIYQCWAKSRRGIYGTNGSMMASVCASSPSKPRPDLFILGFLIDFHGYFKGYASELLKDKKYLSWTILKAHTNNNGGKVSLVSSDPKVRPAINFHYFEEGTDIEGDDLEGVVNGVEISRKISDSMAWLVDHEVLPGGNKITRDDLRQFVKDESWGHHACGTCAMKPESEGGVVDSRFGVYGTKNLRVVDASIFPRIPGFFIVSSVYAVAEKAIDNIIEDAGGYT